MLSHSFDDTLLAFGALLMSIECAVVSKMMDSERQACQGALSESDVAMSKRDMQLCWKGESCNQSKAHVLELRSARHLKH